MARTFYSNGEQFYGDDPPDWSTRGDSDPESTYQWWLPGFSFEDLAQKPMSFWMGTAQTKLFLRELYRNMGGKPSGLTPAQEEHNQYQAAVAARAFTLDPCGSVSSKPRSQRLELFNVAALANWYFFLKPDQQAELLKDVLAGRCARWMPVVLEMRKLTPAAVGNDPAYYIPDWWFFANNVDVENPGPPPVAVITVDNQCCKRAWENAHQQDREDAPPEEDCRRDYPQCTSTSGFVDYSWPVLVNGMPTGLPGLAAPCSPFPACLVPPNLPTPCAPWPQCAWDAVTQIAAAIPGAQVTRDQAGGLYRPTAAPSQPDEEEPTVKSSNVLPIMLGVTAVLALGFAGVMAATAPNPTARATKRVTDAQLAMLSDVRAYGYVTGARFARGTPRLEQLGLIRKRGPGRWELTSKGLDVLETFERTTQPQWITV